MANELLKTGKRRKDRSLESGHSEPGDNSRFLRHSLEISQWGDVQMSDPVQVKERSLKYMEKCIEDDVKPSIEEYALALGISRQALHQYRTGVIGKNAEVLYTLKKTCDLINAQMAHYMQNGKINPVAGIFLMKNNMGYTDKQEVVVSPKNPLGDIPDRKQLESEILESVYGEETPVDD